jgi:putative ABC transport system permease protein
MLYNFIKTAIRFLQKNLSFTIINIIGLSVGISAFLLIALFLQHELSFDKNLPDDVKLYRMVGIQEPSGIDIQHVAITSGGWAPFLNEQVPEVTEAFRLMHASFTIDVDGEVFNERTFYSEGRVVSYFGLPLISGGDESSMLAEPNTAIISREAALRLYKQEDVLGETFRNSGETYRITGVFDTEGQKTHLGFDVLLSFRTLEHDSPWLLYLGSNSVATYLALPVSVNTDNVENIINRHYESEDTGESGHRFMRNTFYLQEAGDIYLRSGHIKFQIYTHIGNMNSVYVFSLVAFLVLAIACINFINLSTANASRRAREVGMRKVLGASRGKLTLQFIGESMVLTFVSKVASLLLLELMIPEFNTLLGVELHIDFIRNPLFNIGLLLILVFVGLLAGLYPGLFMSRYQPTEVLKSQSSSGRPKAAWLRKVLVVFQFAISTALILSTIVVLHQVRYMQAKDRGYDPEHVLFLSFDGGVGYERLDGFSKHLESLPEVRSAALASNYNGISGRQSLIETSDSVPAQLMCRYGYVDPDFFPTMGIDIIEGRNFSHEAATDPFQAAIINESTQRALGWDNPIGKRIQNTYHDDYEYFTIVGVVSDYHYNNVRVPIAPAVYLYYEDGMAVINIRYSADDLQAFRDKIEAEHHGFFPSEVFRSRFLEDVLSAQTRDEENTMKLFLWFSVLCIVISCLGLFGLTSYMMNQRRKEISVRRVLGASVTGINVMLVSSFLRVVLVAVAIALPVTYLIMDGWLNNYSYRIGIGILHFAVSLLIIMSIATATVLLYSTKAARQKPVDNLKYE